MRHGSDCSHAKDKTEMEAILISFYQVVEPLEKQKRAIRGNDLVSSDRYLSSHRDAECHWDLDSEQVIGLL